MALLPSGLAIVGLVVVLAGTALVLALRAFPKAYGLGVLSIAVFALEFLDPRVAVELGLRSTVFWAGEAWWSPLTYMFVHADLFHIAGNLFILLTAGAALEDKMGEGTFVAVYFAAGFAAAIGHLIMVEIIPSVVPPLSLAVGASGAIFGVLTTFAVVFPRRKLPILVYIAPVWFPSFVVLLIHLGFNFIYMLGSTGIAWWGHFSGYLVGLVAAVFLQSRWRSFEPAPVRPEALEALATTPETKEILEKIGTFTGTASDDAVFRDAWIDKLVHKARCPSGHGLTRSGSEVRCASGEYVLDLATR